MKNIRNLAAQLFSSKRPSRRPAASRKAASRPTHSPERLERRLALTTSVAPIVFPPYQGNYQTFIQQPSDDIYVRATQADRDGDGLAEDVWQWSNEASFQDPPQYLNTREAAVFDTGIPARDPTLNPNPLPAINGGFGASFSLSAYFADETWALPAGFELPDPSATDSPWVLGSFQLTLDLYVYNVETSTRTGLAESYILTAEVLNDAFPHDNVRFPGNVPLLFNGNTRPGVVQNVTNLRGTYSDDVAFRGEFNNTTGTVFIWAYANRGEAANNTADSLTNPVSYDLKFDNWFAPVSSTVPGNTIAIMPGQNFNAAVLGSARGPDSVLTVQSPVVTPYASLLAATNIEVASRISVGTGIRFDAESATITTPVTSDQGIVFNIADDPRTDVRKRGNLLVSTSGSLTNNGQGNVNRIIIRGTDADLHLEGRISGATQSYVFTTSTSPISGTFTTKNAFGLSSGLIEGNVVDVFLANNLPVDPSDSLSHTVNIDTAISSLRLGTGNAPTDGTSEDPSASATVQIDAVDEKTITVDAADIAAIQPGDIMEVALASPGDASIVVPFETQVIDVDTATGKLTLSAPVTLPASTSLSFFRFKAGFRPFPYDITVTEADDLAIDGSLSSGGPLTIVAGGVMALNATVLTEEDVTLYTPALLRGNAWITSAAGQIDVTAASVVMSGRMQVLAAPADDALTDISVSAFNGNVVLDGGAASANKIFLSQRGAGRLQLTSPIVTSELIVEADGLVDIQTDVDVVDVESLADVTITEIDSAFFDITAPGAVSLTANGVDSPAAAALRAQIRDPSQVFFTAPNGSINVTAVTAGTIQMGDKALLASGFAPSMIAAGDVSIRSSQAPFIALDAPLAGTGFLTARGATAAPRVENGNTSYPGNLVGTYAQNIPGETPATITGAVGNLNNIGGFEAIFPGFGQTPEGFIPLRSRDLVLLQGQENANENGLYQIVNIGSASQPWVLARTAFTDTTTEFPVNSRIVIQGGSFESVLFQVSAYDNVLDTTPLLSTPSLNRSLDEVTVRFATATPLDGTFSVDQTTGRGVITGTTENLLVNRQVVNDNDLILVQFGTTTDNSGLVASSPANGVYQKKTVNGRWQLERWINPEFNAVVEEATVLVLEGFYSTASTGQSFEVAYNGLGLTAMTIQQDSYSQQIGSFDPRDSMTFVVTTAGGTNNSAGSLGKSLRLIQQNVALDFGGDPVLQQVRFGNVLGSPTGPTGNINLRQELPQISTPMVIDMASRFALTGAGSLPIFVDGTRITATRENAYIGRNDVVNGLEYTSGASATVSPDGLTIRPSSLTGMNISGFENGAAIVIDGPSNILLKRVSVGRDSNRVSDASEYGIVVTGNAGTDGPVSLVDVTVSSSTVFDLTPFPLKGTGVLIEGAAQNVQIAGGFIGLADASNTSGVVVQSSNDNTTRAISIGVNPLPAITVDTRSQKSVLTIPVDTWEIINKDVHLGQSLVGPGMDVNTTVVAIDYDARSLILSKPMISTNTNANITLSSPNRLQITQNFFGVELKSGNVRMTNTTVADNVFDGIRIGTAVPDPIWAQIGAGITLNDAGIPDPKIRSTASNSIYRNGRYGIVFGSGITSQTESPSTIFPFDPVPTVIRIEGNFVGTTTQLTDGLNNLRGNYYWETTGSTTVPSDGSAGTGLRFDSLITSLDPSGPEPALDNGNGNINADLGDPSGSGSGGGGGGGGGGDDDTIPVPPRR